MSPPPPPTKFFFPTALFAHLIDCTTAGRMRRRSLLCRRLLALHVKSRTRDLFGCILGRKRVSTVEQNQKSKKSQFSVSSHIVACSLRIRLCVCRPVCVRKERQPSMCVCVCSCVSRGFSVYWCKCVYKRTYIRVHTLLMKFSQDFYVGH